MSAGFSTSCEVDLASLPLDKSLGRLSRSSSSSDITLSLQKIRESLGLGYVRPPLAPRGGRAGDGLSCDTASSAEGGDTLLGPTVSCGGVHGGPSLNPLPFLRLSLLFLSTGECVSLS